MGDWLALIAALCWAMANVTIARRAGARGDDNGAFLSILLTAGIAGALWLANRQDATSTARMPDAMLWFAAAGALTIFIGRVFLHASIQWLGAVRGASVKRLAPLFSVLLGVSVLSEPLSWALAGGMLLIFSGFGILVQESMRAHDTENSPPLAAPGPVHRAGWANPGIVYGAVSAFAYAAGNIARKYGLLDMPDPLFGTMFGALVGAAIFLLTALAVDSYRQAVRRCFTRFNPWLLATGVLSSAGQLMFFMAVDQSSVSRVAVIASTEVFVTMLLTFVVLRGRENISRAALLAASLGVVGTLLILSEKGLR